MVDDDDTAKGAVAVVVEAPPFADTALWGVDLVVASCR